MARQADILGTAARQAKNQEDLLRSIDESLQDILDNGIDISQSSLGDLKGSYKGLGVGFTAGRSASKSKTDWRPDRSRQQRTSSTSSKGMFDEFTDEIEKSFMKSLFDSSLEDTLKKSISNFADDLGVSVDEIGKEAGNLMGKKIAEKVQKSDNPFVKELLAEAERFKQWGTDKAQSLLKDTAKWLKEGQLPSMSEAKEGVSNIINFASKAKDLAPEIAQTTSTLGTVTAAGTELAGGLTAATGAATAASAAFPWAAAAVVGGLALIEIASNKLAATFQPLTEGLSNFAQSVKKAANSTREMQKQQLKNQQERMKADVNAFIESSFNVLEEATKHMLDTWDQSLSTITATQGYTKADTQDLWSSFASRLQQEGLSSVISSADIMSNLEKVLQSGLSGQVAEEFAYIATILSEAVPTQDFFSYAESYSSLAANQIALGKSQSEALEYANSQLEQFASNLLYSSRELAGGFSTGLKDGSKLLNDAVRIASASKIGDAASISGVLTSVSAIVGAIAPDLASSLVDNVVSAALGGNSATITALRSLSGAGASNTAFLKQLAENPQSIFENLFKNLASLQQMSNDNFMEVAEGLSETFGVSMEAFARVDFNYLANAISAMDPTNTALDQNMRLLVEGQTTSTAEQLRMQEINQTMIEEGLAYVLDNEVARSIQENMWAQERANAMMEATYGVELQGAALELIQSLQHTVQNILDFLNPFSVFKKIGNLFSTSSQSNALNADLAKLIEAGKVGTGNAASLRKLLNQTGTALNRQNYTQLIGLTSSYAKATAQRRVQEAASGQTGWGLNNIGAAAAKAALANLTTTSRARNAASSGVTSRYTWGSLSKTLAGLAGSSYNQGSAYEALNYGNAQGTMQSASATKLQSFFNTMEKFVNDKKSYEDWAATAKKFGITNLGDALADFGLTEEKAREQFQDIQTEAGSKYMQEKDELERQYLKDAIAWHEETWPAWQNQIYKYSDQIIEYEEVLIDRADTEIKQLIQSNTQLKEFYDQWIDYYVNHTAYSKETLNAYDVAAIRNAEKSETGDAVLALAQALTSNMVDLKDPTVQSNVLLSQILIVVEAIMQQTNDTTTVSLPTALSALGLNTISTDIQV